LAKKLIAYCGGVEAVFKESKKSLLLIPGIGTVVANSILSQKVLSSAELEIRFMSKHTIDPVFFLDENYSFRLKQCADAPIMLYTKGNVNLNTKKVISIVCTRSATSYGKQSTEKIIEGLSQLDDVIVVSGLAYGIDIAAHKACLKYNVPTLAVLAHGLDRVYPKIHTRVFNDIQATGGLISEFTSGTKPAKENFPKRNRIIAGLADATLVVEARKGGALITSGIANSYSRDVFALPGRVGDENSEGCNNLIRTNQAALIQSSNDICYLMNWDKKVLKNQNQQTSLFLDLTEEEQLVFGVIYKNDRISLDRIIFMLNLSRALLLQVLLQLELKGLIESLPRMIYIKS